MKRCWTLIPTLRDQKEFITVRQAISEQGRDPASMPLYPNSKENLSGLAGQQLKSKRAEQGPREVMRVDGQSLSTEVNTYRRAVIYAVLDEIIQNKQPGLPLFVVVANYFLLVRFLYIPRPAPTTAPADCGCITLNFKRRHISRMMFNLPMIFSVVPQIKCQWNSSGPRALYISLKLKAVLPEETSLIALSSLLIQNIGETNSR